MRANEACVRDERLQENVWLLSLKTPTLAPATATNTLVLGKERIVVIEPATPYPAEQTRLFALLDALQAEGREIVALCLTHHHVDHIGAIERLRDRYQAPIVAEARTAARLDFSVDRVLDGSLADLDGSAKLPWSCDLGGGMALEALFTPGHSDGHLIFWEQQTQVAYGGDLVASEGTILINPEDGGDMAAYVASLRRCIRHFEAVNAQLIPSHGAPIGEPVAILERYVAHRLARESRVMAGLRSGCDRYDALLAYTYADVADVPWGLAALSLDAHLFKIKAEATGTIPKHDEFMKFQKA